jgi:outer membrane protein assembly factor BamA
LKRLKYISFLLVQFFILELAAQEKYVLDIVINDSISDIKQGRLPNFQHSFVTSQDRELEIKKYFYSLREMGYLAAALDSVQKDSIRLSLFLTKGNKYQYAALKRGNVDDEILSAVGFREKFYSGRAFSPKELARLLEQMLIFEENNGYPFATIKLDSITIQKNEIGATLQLTKNKLCLIDSFVIFGNARISRYYLQRQIGIKKGDRYNESRIRGINKRIREVPFLSEKKNSEIYFSERYTKLILYVDEKKANRFDGVLGFLPNETTGKLLLTGQLTLKLSNSFNKGEILDIDWQKLQARTQNLKARLQIPFLFRSPFGADLNFKLYKRDTLFIDVSENIGLNYLLGINNYFKVYFANRDLSLISTRGLETATTLPPNADINTKSYGIGFRTERVDYKFNPRKGFILDINGSAGTKLIKKNVKLNPLIYEKLDTKTNLYTVDFFAEVYIPIKKRSTFVFGNKSAFIESENLFTNELFRIGGLSSLRGFDEESINTSAYTISKLEYRFLLDQNSFLFLFANHAYYENKTSRDSNNKIVDDNPYGFGAGITFETKPGIFSLSYALGKQFNNPISVRSAKIHFGIISTF